MTYNDAFFLGTLFYKEITYEKGSQVLMTEIYDAYLKFCATKNKIPLKKIAFVKFFSDLVSNYSRKIVQISIPETKNFRFINIRLSEGIEIELCISCIKELEQVGKQRELTPQEKDDLDFFKETLERFRKKKSRGQ